MILISESRWRCAAIIILNAQRVVAKSRSASRGQCPMMRVFPSDGLGHFQLVLQISCGVCEIAMFTNVRTRTM